MKQNVKMILSIILGNAMLAFAVCAFVVPNGIMLGGSNGIALFIQLFLPEVRLSVISAVVNVGLFLLGWAFLGWKFAGASLLSTILYPLILGYFETLPLGTLFSENIVLSGLACGVLFGLGIGIVVRGDALGTFGGSGAASAHNPFGFLPKKRLTLALGGLCHFEPLCFQFQIFGIICLIEIHFPEGHFGDARNNVFEEISVMCDHDQTAREF